MVHVRAGFIYRQLTSSLVVTNGRGDFFRTSLFRLYSYTLTIQLRFVYSRSATCVTAVHYCVRLYSNYVTDNVNGLFEFRRLAITDRCLLSLRRGTSTIS